MEAYSSNSSSSSSGMNLSQYSQEPKGFKTSQSYHSSLHSIRKPHVKPWKQPIAPLPPTPPKVYKVDPVNFRDLVQKLTGAPQSQSQQRLRSVAPPPLDLATPALFGRQVSTPWQLLPLPAETPFSATHQDFMPETLGAKHIKMSDSVMPSNSLELNLSPSAHGWCSLPLLSPGTLAILEQSAVL